MALTIAETHTTGGSTVGASPYAITVTADQTAAGLGSVQISPTEHTKAAGAASAGSMIAFDKFGNQRNTNQAFVSSFQLFLTATQDSNAMVGAPLSLAVTDGNSYSVSLLGTLAGNYALAVRFNGSSTMLDIPLTSPVGMTVTYGEISARGSQVTSDVAHCIYQARRRLGCQVLGHGSRRLLHDCKNCWTTRNWIAVFCHHLPKCCRGPGKSSHFRRYS